jgi:hypothetical protein
VTHRCAIRATREGTEPPQDTPCRSCSAISEVSGEIPQRFRQRLEYVIVYIEVDEVGEVPGRVGQGRELVVVQVELVQPREVPDRVG